MAPRIFDRLTSSRGSRSFYNELRNQDHEIDVEDEAGRNVDEENLRHNFNELDAEGLTAADSRITVDSAPYIPQTRGAGGPSPARSARKSSARWPPHDEDLDNDVPASLLVEHRHTNAPQPTRQQLNQSPSSAGGPSTAPLREQWEAATGRHMLFNQNRRHSQTSGPPKSLMSGGRPGSPRERALWKWVNTTNLDSFMRDVYDYYQGGGIWCILCANALWLLYVDP
jgi:autophagy-related protein 9